MSRGPAGGNVREAESPEIDEQTAEPTEAEARELAEAQAAEPGGPAPGASRPVLAGWA